MIFVVPLHREIWGSDKLQKKTKQEAKTANKKTGREPKNKKRDRALIHKRQMVSGIMNKTLQHQKRRIRRA